MAFVNLSLLAGGLLMAIPVVLHLVMRQQPMQLVFPAMRFIKQRRDANRRRLQLRHWLLLFLRCLAVVVAAVALARPSVASTLLGNWMVIGALGLLLLVAGLLFVLAAVQKKGKTLLIGFGAATGLLLVLVTTMLAATLSGSSGKLIGDREAPVSAVLIIDTSPRMQLRHENRTRLEIAQDTANWLLRQLPGESEVAIVESRPGAAAFAVDQAAARKAVERLQITGVPQPVTELLDRALTLASRGRFLRREVYVFSDLNRLAWETERDLQKKLHEHPDIALHVIDVGIDKPSNFSLGELQLSTQSLTKNGELRLTTELQCVGPAGPRSVKLFVEDYDPNLPVLRDGEIVVPPAQHRGTELCDVPSGGGQTVQFTLRGLDRGLHQGYVKIAGEDALAFDDVRYFAVDVQDAWPVLVAAPRGVTTAFLTEAIAPFELRQTGQARFQCEVIQQADLASKKLDDFAAVCLLDPQPLSPTDWESLAAFVKRGGGLGVFLGHNAMPVATFNDPVPRQLLGGQLTRQWRATDDLFFAPRSLDHPVLAEFRSLATSVPWHQFPVYRHWGIEGLGPTSRVVFPYSNRQPALIETTLGRGRVLTLTTPISEPARPAGRAAWNELVSGEDAWPYFVLINETLLYLVQSRDAKLNYLTGQSVTLSNREDRDPERYQLFLPRNETLEVQARDGELRIRSTELPGAYRLKGNRGGPVVRGFAVNLSPEASRLDRVTSEQLDSLLGRDRYRLAKQRDEIVLGVGETRVGREFFPYLLPMLLLVLALEQLLANRFYSSGTTLAREATA